MNNEEMQQAIQFLLEQQSQFVGDLHKLNESQLRLTESHFRVMEATLANTAQIGQIGRFLETLTEGQVRTEASVAALAKAQAQTDAKMAELAERLDTFIVFVEKYIAEGRNGKQ